MLVPGSSRMRRVVVTARRLVLITWWQDVINANNLGLDGCGHEVVNRYIMYMNVCLRKNVTRRREVEVGRYAQIQACLKIRRSVTRPRSNEPGPNQ